MRPTLPDLMYRAWVWSLRVLATWVMLTHWLPRPLLLVYLEWQRESLAPDHPALGQTLAEIAAVREQCRA